MIYKMDYQNSAAKYKSVLKKVKPVNEPMPQDINPPLKRPPLSRDPYNTPLSPKPPKFMVTSKITQERFELINFGPPGWLSEEESSLLMSVIVLREEAICFQCRGKGFTETFICKTLQNTSNTTYTLAKEANTNTKDHNTPVY